MKIMEPSTRNYFHENHYDLLFSVIKNEFSLTLGKIVAVIFNLMEENFLRNSQETIDFN